MFILSKYAQRSIYQAPSYLKKQSNFCKDISISGLSSKEMITFSCTDEHQNVAEKYSPKKKKKKKKKNSNGIEYGSVEDP